MSNLPATTSTLALSEQMEFARAVSVSSGRGSILPEQYRDNPANVLVAVGLGQSMGLSPAESLYRIAVIKGKPSAGAELIAANVRKAGHKLRVRGTEETCTATIVRADDPDFEFTVTRDLAWAKRMGLATNDNYRKQPGTMLQWRAISAVARLACPEALYGVTYTPDEIGETLPDRPAEATRQAPEPITLESFSEATSEPAPEPPAEDPLTDKTRRTLFALFGRKGVPEDQQLAGINHRLGTTYTSRKQLTETNAVDLIFYLETLPDADTLPVDGADQ